jgi:hypothetical protein
VEQQHVISGTLHLKFTLVIRVVRLIQDVTVVRYIGVVRLLRSRL